MHFSPNGSLWTSYKFLTEQFERRLKQAVSAAARFDKLITSFSAGGIVFSATLLPVFAPLKLLLCSLFASWAFFLLAIVCVAFATYNEQQMANEAAIETANLLGKISDDPELAAAIERGDEGFPVKIAARVHPAAKWLNLVGLVFFLFGVALLGIFAGYNVWKTPPSQPKHYIATWVSSDGEIRVRANKCSVNTAAACLAGRGFQGRMRFSDEEAAHVAAVFCCSPR